MNSIPRIASLFMLIGVMCIAVGCGGPTEPAEPAQSAEPDAEQPVETSPADTGEPASGDWLVGRLPAEMPTLNPYTSTDAYSSGYLSLVFDSLLDRDNETMEMTPELAESWEISEDHLTYTFTLREGVVFSDGRLLTVEDVVFSYETIQDPDVLAPHLRNYFKDVTGCEAIDERTVRFTCSQPYYRHIVMIGSLEIIPKHIYGEGDFNNHPNNRNPIGSGPYKVEKWEAGKEISLVRNEKYWGDVIGVVPHFDKRLDKIITDSNAAFQVLQAGELDYMSVQPDDWTKRADTKKFKERFNKLAYTRPAYYYIGYNSRLPLFSDKKVRRAMTLMLDRETVRDAIFKGFAQIVTGNFMPGTPEYNPSITPWPFDPEGARKLLDEAGWVDSDGDGIRDKDGQAFRFELLIGTGNPNAEKVATMFSEEVRRSGIEMRIRQLEWSTLTSTIDERKFDAVFMGWSMPPDPDPYQVWHSSGAEAGSNYVAFINEEADRLIEEARVNFDRDQRIKLYHRFQEIIHEEQPYTFLVSPKSLLAVDKRIHGITMYPYGPDSMEWYVPLDLQRYQ